ncbi:putative topbp1 [Aphelenchoides besseyi]|nr:putative topbp1 [Aphelenchoides besseyi]KAI6223448.1 putative topbp1 [Aphelenchoides besseyi]
MAFKNTIVCFTGLSSEEKVHYEERIRSMGGDVKPELSQSTQILIAKNCETSPKYRAACCWKIPICGVNLIAEMAKQKGKHVSEFVSANHNKFSVPIFTDCIICSSGVTTEERIAIGHAVEQNGGRYVLDLTRGEATHLVTDRLTGEKYKHAKIWGIKIVTTRWLHKCLVRRLRCPEEYYNPDPAINKTFSKYKSTANEQSSAPSNHADVTIAETPCIAKSKPSQLEESAFVFEPSLVELDFNKTVDGHDAETAVQTPDQMTVQNGVNTAVEAPANESLETAYEPTVETAIETSLEMAVETAVETAAEIDAETAIETTDAALETGVENSVETAVETSVEPVVEAPVETPVEAVVEALVESKLETAVETTVETMVETMNEPTAEKMIEPAVANATYTIFEMEADDETQDEPAVETTIEKAVETAIEMEPENETQVDCEVETALEMETEECEMVPEVGETVTIESQQAEDQHDETVLAVLDNTMERVSPMTKKRPVRLRINTRKWTSKLLDVSTSSNGSPIKKIE